MSTTLNAPEAQEVVYRFPGISFISQALTHNKSRRVLDLGAASAASFNFFMRKSCTVRFENVSLFVADQMSASPDGNDPAVIRKHLEDYLGGFRSHEKFDVVLAWDLFNFLDLDTISWLMGKLGQYCHDQSLLHSVRYTAKLPLTPVQFQIVNENEVKFLSGGQVLRGYEYHSLPDLVCNLPFYHLDTSFNLQTGMPKGVGEDIFRFLPSKKNVLRHSAKMELPSVSAQSLPGTEHRSYALESMCDYLTNIESPRILDLGAHIDSNEEFYRNFSNDIVFAEIYQDLKRDISADEILFKEKLFNCQPDEKFDVIFAWGLLGYCTQAQLLALKERLLPHIHSNTKIHVVIYAGYTQPTTPDKYYIKNTQTLHLPDVEDYCNTHPPLTAIRLLKILGDASYESSYIMKPGMAPNFFEHVLVLQKTEAKSRKKKRA
ncbi:hypothetical protein [Marinagarivorans cellulosilyticus]|uniref:Uncharacterized protein n=1 Tax=Marinagarivorans cellulosilyticus TaxID=2721545 RepID=A0AAN1WGP0_9GAMM|nr:hypothetical protein [Marinagarivorans cellulosilyticus]BCD97220.1 hypothetical protein MARGE09_P1421 [Marinagarivorans cellulosilyticus]